MSLIIIIIIGNGPLWFEWSRDWWRHVTQKGQGHDPNIFDANYLDNGWRYELRVSTNLTEQISRRFPGDSKRYFKKIPVRLYCFGLLCNVPNLLVCLNIEQKHDMYNMGAVAKIKRATTLLNKRSGTSFIMTGNQCRRSLTFYTKISRRTIQIQGDSLI